MSVPWFETESQKLSLRASDESLHHALLFSGTKGIGKSVFADGLAQQLLCQSLAPNGEACGQCQSCDLYKAGSHPDFYRLTTDKTQLGVDLIRQAIQSLTSTAQLQHNKVLVIPDAHLMSESASNALLKTLEEPTSKTFIILLTPFVSRLLPTILSRCEKHTLHGPDYAQCIQWLKQYDNLVSSDVQISEALFEAYGGAPFTLLDALQGEGELTFDEFCRDIDAAISSRNSALPLAEKWQAQYSQVIEWTQRYLNQRIKSRDQTANPKHWDIYESLNQFSLTAQHAGVNKVLLLSQLFNLMSEVE